MMKRKLSELKFIGTINEQYKTSILSNQLSIPKLEIIKFSDYKNAPDKIKNKIIINSNKKYLKYIKEKIEFYEELKFENNWQEINLKIRKMELMRKINNEDKHENLIKEIRECYENIDKQG